MSHFALSFTILNLYCSLLTIPITAKGLPNLRCAQVIDKNDLPFCISANYRKDTLPVTNNPMNISVLVRIFDIVEVNDVDSTVTFSMLLGITWTEPRLQMIFNSSSWIDTGGKKWAVLNRKILDYLWTPDFHILNTKQFKFESSLQELGYLELYDAKRFWYELPVEVTLGCPQFDFKKYPLDEQICEFRIGSFIYNANQSLYTGQLVYNKNSQRALQYDVRDIRTLTFEEGLVYYRAYYYTDDGKMDYKRNTFSYFVIKVTFNRMIQPHLLCTYLPSLLFVVSSWLGFLIDPSSPGRIGLPVTLLLMLTNMRSVS